MMLADALENLFREQVQSFVLARQNYAALEQVIYRDLPCSGFRITLQYNPARMISTNAKLDSDTLESRKCFLCRSNMPREQKGIPFGERYHIYINPYPIFAKHFTVPADQHAPQRIEGRFEDMLDLSFELKEYTVFYNGADCGASAPDHFHFQVAPRHVMPLEEDADNDRLLETIVKEDFHSIYVLRDYLRKVIIFRASDRWRLSALFNRLMGILRETVPCETEPMVNLLCWFDNCQWTVCIFPRRLRRPWQFFAEGEEKILFSPGCVDMAGLIIAPRREDFNRYSGELLTDLFSQVSIDDAAWATLLRQIKN